MKKNSEYLRGAIKVNNEKEIYRNVILRIYYKNELPLKSTIIWVNKGGFPTKYINSQITKIDFQTENEKIEIELNGNKMEKKTNSISILYSKNDTLIRKDLISNKKISSIKEGKTEVKFVINKICFLRQYKKNYKVEALKNLSYIEEINKKYTFDFIILNETYQFGPYLYYSEKENHFRAKYYISKIYDYIIPFDELLKKIKYYIDSLIKIIGFLDNRLINCEEILIEIRNKEEYYKFHQWNFDKVKKYKCSHMAVITKDWLSTLEKIYSAYQNLSEENKHKILVVFRRFYLARRASDITIIVTLYHVSISLLSSIINRNGCSFKSHKIIRKFFKNNNISFKEENVNDLISFNKNRNKIFKKVSLNNDYNDEFFNNLNDVLMFTPILFAKALNLDSKSESIILKSIRKNYLLKTVD